MLFRSIFTQANQVNAVSPYSVNPSLASSQLRVTYNGLQSAPLTGTTVQFSVPLIQPAERLAQARRAKEERYQRVYWATTLFGKKPADVKYIAYASRHGLGNMDLNDIRVSEITL